MKFLIMQFSLTSCYFISLWSKYSHCHIVKQCRSAFLPFCQRPSFSPNRKYRQNYNLAYSLSYVRFEVFTAVTMKNGIFWDVMPCGSCKSWRFGGRYHLHHRGDKNRWTSNRRTLRRNTKESKDFVFLCSVRRLLVTANVVPSSPILVTLMMEAIRSSKTSVLTRATRRNIPEDTIPFFLYVFRWWTKR
jgi:hypothetical protein